MDAPHDRQPPQRPAARHWASVGFAVLFVALVVVWVVRALAGGDVAPGGRGPVALVLAAAISGVGVAVGTFLLRRFPRDRTVPWLFVGMVGAAAAFGLPAQRSLSSRSALVVAATLSFEVLVAAAYVVGLWGLLVSPKGHLITLPHPPRASANRLAGATIGAIALVVSLHAVVGIDAHILAFAVAVTVLANGLIAQLVHARRPDPEEQRSAVIFSGLLELGFVVSALLVLLCLAVRGWGVYQFMNPLETSAGDPQVLLVVVAPLFVGLPVLLFLATTRRGLATLQKPFDLLSLRQVEYLSLSLLITGFYVAVHVGTEWVFQHTMEPLHLSELAGTALVTLVVVVLFEPFKERLSEWIRRRLDRHGEGTHVAVARMLQEFAAADPGEFPGILAKWARKASRADAARVTLVRTSGTPDREFWWPVAARTELGAAETIRYAGADVGFVAVAQRPQQHRPWWQVRRRLPTSTYGSALLSSLASASAMAMWVAGQRGGTPAQGPRPSVHHGAAGGGPRGPFRRPDLGRVSAGHTGAGR